MAMRVPWLYKRFTGWPGETGEKAGLLEEGFDLLHPPLQHRQHEEDEREETRRGDHFSASPGI